MTQLELIKKDINMRIEHLKSQIEFEEYMQTTTLDSFNGIKILEDLQNAFQIADKIKTEKVFILLCWIWGAKHGGITKGPYMIEMFPKVSFMIGLQTGKKTILEVKEGFGFVIFHNPGPADMKSEEHYYFEHFLRQLIY